MINSLREFLENEARSCSMGFCVRCGFAATIGPQEYRYHLSKDVDIKKKCSKEFYYIKIKLYLCTQIQNRVDDAYN